MTHRSSPLHPVTAANAGAYRVADIAAPANTHPAKKHRRPALSESRDRRDGHDRPGTHHDPRPDPVDAAAHPDAATARDHEREGEGRDQPDHRPTLVRADSAGQDREGVEEHAPRHDLCDAQHGDSAGRAPRLQPMRAGAGEAGSTRARRRRRSRPVASSAAAELALLVAVEVTLAPAATGALDVYDAGLKPERVSVCSAVGAPSARYLRARDGVGVVERARSVADPGREGRSTLGGLEVAVGPPRPSDLLVTGHREERRRAAVGLHPHQEQALLGLGQLRWP